MDNFVDLIFSSYELNEFCKLFYQSPIDLNNEKDTTRMNCLQ